MCCGFIWYFVVYDSVILVPILFVNVSLLWDNYTILENRHRHRQRIAKNSLKPPIFRSVVDVIF